jgi:ABC-type tungstate transport system substrate-binding protein
MVGAIAFATLFTAGNLIFAAYGVAAVHLNILELPVLILFIPFGAAIFIFPLSLVFSLAITVPLSFVIAMCAFPFLRTLQAAGERAFGVVGFVAGMLVWSAIWWNGPPGHIYFGSWISSFIIGGSAGCAGGLAFARHLPQRH